MESHGYFVGVDGCRKGWVSVRLQTGRPAQLDVFETLADLWEMHNGAELILIDMPIGLLEAGPAKRQCDVEARRAVGPRRSSVFAVPCRQAVYANSNDDAVSENNKHMGKGLPLQALSIRIKIREVDKLLRTDVRARTTLREVHPELLFSGMNSGNPPVHWKRSPEGKREREKLLSRVVGKKTVDYVLAEGRRHLRRDLQDDDVLDALAAAVAASHHDELVSLPENPPFDVCGLPMQMVYWPHLNAA